MARPLRIQFPGAFYHVMCRGNNRRNIFLDPGDRYRFLEQLSESLKIYGVVLYAYVMMNNHFHLVIKTTRANLGEFMRRFNISYTAWMNYRHKTHGHLYQGRYKSIIVDADNYLLELSRYVHLNPVRARRFREGCDFREQWRYLAGYRWSSLPSYILKRHRDAIVDHDLLLEMAGGRDAYQQFVLEGIKSTIRNPFDDLRFQTILGDNDFVERTRSEHLEMVSLREQPSLRTMASDVIQPVLLIERVAENLGVDMKTLSTRRGDAVDRGITADLLYRYSGLSQSEIGQLLGGIDYTAVSMLRKRLKTKMEKDQAIKARYDGAERSLLSL